MEQENLPLAGAAPVEEKEFPQQGFWVNRSAGLTLAAIVMVVDLLSKWMVLAVVDKLPLVIIPGLFHFTFAWNKGVSFSFLGDVDGFIFGMPADALVPVFLSAVALIAIGLFTWWMVKEERLLGKLAVGLIIGGAAGNMIDRLMHGAVVDFLHVYWQEWHFPIFNLADVWITIGVILLIFDGFRGKKSA